MSLSEDLFVEAHAEIAGTFSKLSQTWLWSWASSDVNPDLTAGAVAVRAYGEEHGFEDLTAAQWEGSESDGWVMAAVELQVAKGAGLYSADLGDGRVFFMIRSMVG